MKSRTGDSATILCSPLRGWVLRLDEVPDPVFAQRMLGDGVAIDPIGETLFAPCDARVVNIHAARHALTLRLEDDVEILLHLGLDSVALNGQGITALVEAGSAVRQGQPLLNFDLDCLVTGATAAITPMIIADKERFSAEIIAGGLVEPGSPLVRIGRRKPASHVSQTGQEVVRRLVEVALPHGIHARPAARLADVARRFSVDASFIFDERRAAASSALALLGLGVKQGGTVAVEVSGANASAALDAFERLLADPALDAPPPPQQAAPALASSPPGKGPGLRGISAAPGAAIGKAFRFHAAKDTDRAIGNPADITGEHERFETALAEEGSALREEAAAPGVAGAILSAQLAFLEDPTLLASAREGIAKGLGAEAAWREAIKLQVDALLAAGDQRIAERVEDLRDLETRLLARLSGSDDQPVVIPEASIVIATELLPSQTAKLDPSKVSGIALMEGGPTSHAAILAAGLGIPMAVAFGASLEDIADGTLLILDADRGTLEIDPSKQRIAELNALAKSQALAGIAAASGPCRSADGVRIELFANLGSVSDAQTAVREGAEGCGLLRTEFLFLDRSDPPTEAEQLMQYQAIADALGERPFVVRLLDVGSDKPAPYIRIPAEENPALGLRGIRVGLAQPGILETQLRAILAVEPPGRCRIMPPMIADVAEFDAVADLVKRLAIELGISDGIELGAMVETPAAALIAPQLARRAAFLSIGSNDLSQYALAMDRGNAAVAGGLDGLHPAVLRLIGAVCEGAREHDVPVAVCGGLAADRLAVPILLGLGVTELSVPPARVRATRAAVACLSVEQCRALAREVLAFDSAAAVRERLARFQEDPIC